MPMINTKTNVAITPEQETQLKTEFGKAISILPGKSEQWLMLDFKDNCRMYFQGDNSEPMAFVEVKVYGSIDYNKSNQLTAKLSEILSDVLSINPSKTYIKYEEVGIWGWSGSNF